MRNHRTLITPRIALLLISALALSCFATSPVAYAGAPFSNPSAPSHDPTQQDLAWLALKNAYRIRSGIRPGQGKGAKTQPFVAATPFVLTSAPSSYELSVNDPVPTTFEPGDGCHSCAHYNFTGSGYTTASYDDARKGYSAHTFVDLCGPGAADIALWYWPPAPSWTNLSNVYDNWDNVATTWDATDIDSVTRMRGYLMDLAWDITAPSFQSNGFMNALAPRANAVQLQVMRDGMNWEASGESSNWQTYFYIVQWHGSSDDGTLHSEIVDDVYANNVPIVAEVNAQLMPNWQNNGGLTRHYVTIIGYDDTHSTYKYTDTCAKITGCGSQTNGNVQSVSYSQLWKAIVAVPVNQGTGDGGWVW